MFFQPHQWYTDTGLCCKRISQVKQMLLWSFCRSGQAYQLSIPAGSDHLFVVQLRALTLRWGALGKSIAHTNIHFKIMLQYYHCNFTSLTWLAWAWPTHYRPWNLIALELCIWQHRGKRLTFTPTPRKVSHQENLSLAGSVDRFLRLAYVPKFAEGGRGFEVMTYILRSIYLGRSLQILNPHCWLQNVPLLFLGGTGLGHTALILFLWAHQLHPESAQPKPNWP